jgi:hypothetical protein
MFEAERMIGAIGNDQVALPPDASSRVFVAGEGRYRFDGTELVATVDGASTPDDFNWERVR